MAKRSHLFRSMTRRAFAAAGRRSGVCCAQSGGGVVRREVLTRQERTKLDASDDYRFYAVPRIVKHVDDGFLAQVTQLYRWVSHLPPERKYSRVVGHGMNAAELARNDRLDDFFVRNLNFEPDGWALEDASVDAVTCCVSIQYVQQPERVFSEIYRVLKPGGVCIITFSNRMFYEKAIAAWRDATGYARCQLVKSYFQAVAGFTESEVLLEVPVEGASGVSSNPFLAMIQRLFQRTSTDPFYGVVAYRNFKRTDA